MPTKTIQVRSYPDWELRTLHQDDLNQGSVVRDRFVVSNKTFNIKCDRVPDIGDGLINRFALTDTAGQTWHFDGIPACFIGHKNYVAHDYLSTKQTALIA